MNVTFFVNGFTVNLNSPEIELVRAETVPELEPPTVRVPPFSFGEPCGSSWFDTIWNVLGPFAKPSTRNT